MDIIDAWSRSLAIGLIILDDGSQRRELILTESLSDGGVTGGNTHASVAVSRNFRVSIYFRSGFVCVSGINAFPHVELQ